MAAAGRPGHDGLMTNTQPHDSATPGAGPAATPPPSDETPHQQSPGLGGWFEQIRGLGVHRSRDNWIAGVCSGLARRFNIDPAIIRAAAIVLLIFGIGLLLYLIAWALLPDEDGSIIAERAIRDGDGWGIFLLVVIAISVVGTWAGNNSAWAFPVLVGGGAVGLWYVLRNRSTSSAGGGPSQHPPSAAPTAPAAAPPSAGPYSTPYPATPQQAWQTGTASSVGYEPPANREEQAGHAHQSTQDAGSGAYDRPKAPRAGLAGLLLVLGAIIIGAGVGIQLAHNVGISATLGGLFGATGLAGLATVILGLLGRRSFLASLASIALAFSLVATWGVGNVPTQGFGDQTWRPTVATEQSSYTWSMGSATLDLRELTEAREQTEISASVSFGELVVYVPEGITTRINASTQFGHIAVDGLDNASIREANGGTEVSRTYVFGEGEPQLTVNAQSRFGSLRILTTTDPTSSN